MDVQFLNRAHEALDGSSNVFRWAHTVRLCPKQDGVTVEKLQVFSCCGGIIGGAQLAQKPERCVELSPIIFRNEKFGLDVTLKGQTPCDWKIQ